EWAAGRAADPGGGAVTGPWEAEVELAAGERLPRVVLPRLAGAAVARAPTSSSAMGCSQTRRWEPMASSWVAASRMVSALARTRSSRGGKVVGGQRLGAAVGEAVGPAVPAGAGEGDEA